MQKPRRATHYSYSMDYFGNRFSKCRSCNLSFEEGEQWRRKMSEAPQSYRSSSSCSHCDVSVRLSTTIIMCTMLAMYAVLRECQIRNMYNNRTMPLCTSQSSRCSSRKVLESQQDRMLLPDLLDRDQFNIARDDQWQGLHGVTPLIFVVEYQPKISLEPLGRRAFEVMVAESCIVSSALTKPRCIAQHATRYTARETLMLRPSPLVFNEKHETIEKGQIRLERMKCEHQAGPQPCQSAGAAWHCIALRMRWATPAIQTCTPPICSDVAETRQSWQHRQCP